MSKRDYKRWSLVMECGHTQAISAEKIEDLPDEFVCTGPPGRTASCGMLARVVEARELAQPPENSWRESRVGLG